jgi:hypothetical protein
MGRLSIRGKITPLSMLKGAPCFLRLERAVKPTNTTTFEFAFLD